MDGLGSVIPSIDMSAPTTAAVTVKADETDPPPAVTTRFPEVTGALAGTVVVIVVALPVTTVAATPPMVTVAPVRPVPVIVTGVPTWPDVGERRVITGAAAGGGDATVNANDAAGATFVVTTTLPKPTIALLGTVVNICVPLLLIMFAAAPPIVTRAPAMFAPLMVTAEPDAPFDRERPVMSGGDVVGGKTTAVPHPPVLMFRAPPLKETETAWAALHVTPSTTMTLAVCA